MATFSNGESGSSVRTKLNDIINKVEGVTSINNDIDVTGTVTADGLTVDGSVSVNHNIITQTANAPRIDIMEADVTDKNTRIWQTAGQLRIYSISDDTTTYSERIRLDHATGDISFYEDQGITPKFFWDASAESLGIGTSSVDLTSTGRTVVQVEGSSNALLNLTDGTSRLYLHQKGGTSGADIWNSANSYMRFATNNTERMRINADGSCRWTPDGTNPDMTLDASGNLLVGKTVTTLNTEGHALTPTYARFTRDGAAPVQFNRTTSDGDITIFYKDGAPVGSIGTINGDTYLITGDTGIRLYDLGDAVIPVTTNGASSDNARDLGYSSIRWRDLYLSNAVVQSGVKATTTATTQVTLETFAHASHDGAKVVITAATSADTYVTELLIATNGTTAVATEYGQIGTGSALATYDVDISGADVRILATPASTTSTTFRVAMTLT